jgi:pimeloyl-ACP methyl ester carboxylesterase
MASAHDAYARLPDVTCPVAVACGSESEGCPPERAQSYVELLPRGRSEVLPGLGHLGPLENPELVAASVGAFLAGVCA